jgi:hypothetical protein
MYSKSSSLDAAFGVTKFITINTIHLVTLGVNVIKLFSFITEDEALSNQALEFKGKARANPIGAPFGCFLLG